MWRSEPECLFSYDTEELRVGIPPSPTFCELCVPLMTQAQDFCKINYFKRERENQLNCPSLGNKQT